MVDAAERGAAMPVERPLVFRDRQASLHRSGVVTG
jgi:hypothetical protein